MQNNRKLLKAQRGKRDEFYTRRETIEKELVHYKRFLKDQIVYCNCDDPRRSQFWAYLKDHFTDFGLKALISTFYSEAEQPFKTVMKRDSIGRLYTRQTPLKGNGDYNSPECRAILEEATIVITNPPFSLLKYYLPLMYEYKKKFLILGTHNVLSYQDMLPHIFKGDLCYGVSIRSGGTEFVVPPDYQECTRIDDDGTRYAVVSNARWLTNIKTGHIPERMDLKPARYHLQNNEKLINTLKDKYNTDTYPKYTNYDALEVPVTECIPSDYEGTVGVPLSFFDKYNPEQFRIVGFRKGDDGKDLVVGDVRPYVRFLIQLI